MGNAESKGEAPPPPPPEPPAVDEAALAAFSKHSSAAAGGSGTIADMFERATFDDPYSSLHAMVPAAPPPAAPLPPSAGTSEASAGGARDSPRDDAAQTVARLLQTSFWSDVLAPPPAESHGAPEADMRALGAAIQAAMDRVRASAVTARKAAQAPALIAEVDRCELAKLTALKEEAAAADKSLGLAARVCRDAAKALASRAPPETLRMHAGQLEAILRLELPCAPVEPAVLVFVPAAAGAGGGGGRIMAPRGVRPEDLRCDAPPIARPGRPFTVDVSLDATTYPTADAAELGVALESLALHAVVEVTLLPPGASEVGGGALDDGALLFGGPGGGVPLPLRSSGPPATLPDSRGVRFSVPVPAGAGAGATVVVSRVLFARKPVPPGAVSLPLRAPILTTGGLSTPQRLAAPGRVQSTPAVSISGDLFLPTYSDPAVTVYGPGGDTLPPIDVAAIGLSTSTRAAAVCDGTGSLLLSDFNGDASRVVALDLRSRAVRWATEPGAWPAACDIAVLSAVGVAVVGLCPKGAPHRLQTLALRDGRRVPTGGADVPAGAPRFLAADQATRTVYASAGDGVGAWTWDPAGSRLVPGPPPSGAGRTGAPRPLAVVPPTPGRRTAHLVVGTVDKGELRVLELPSGHLVHTHELAAGARVTGLAGDPTGTALVVRDGESALVLPWPLPGMARIV